MRIGILTFYRVPNFGANLQAVSTYLYLKKIGHTPIFLHYISEWASRIYKKNAQNLQFKAHFDFVDSIIIEQSGEIHTSDEMRKAIKEYKIDAIIVGSDAVAQHHPLFSTLNIHQSLKSWLRPIQPELRFPHLYWGCGYIGEVPMAFMSVSSQNSPYKKFSSSTRCQMKEILNQLTYASVRDTWTQNLYKSVGYVQDVPITPDPVFAFNQNASELIPTKEDICNRFHLPEKYALIGLKSQVLSFENLTLFKNEMEKKGISSVAFPIITGIKYKHPFNHVINTPLSPIDWYAIIRYSQAYIGNNMHPIVVCLHNAIPCFSLDNWGTTDFWGKKIKDNSSKVLDILTRAGIPDYRSEVENGKCACSMQDILLKLNDYPADRIKIFSEHQVNCYNNMMSTILNSFINR